MTKTTTRSKKGAEKLVTKVGRSLGMMKAAVVEWMVGPTPGISRAAIDWKMEVFVCTKIVAKKWVRNETYLLQRVYKLLRPNILVYGRPDCTRLVLKFMFIWHNVPCVHKPFATVAQCIMNSFHGGQVFASEP